MIAQTNLQKLRDDMPCEQRIALLKIASLLFLTHVPIYAIVLLVRNDQSARVALLYEMFYSSRTNSAAHFRRHGGILRLFL